MSRRMGDQTKCQELRVLCTLRCQRMRETSAAVVLVGISGRIMAYSTAVALVRSRSCVGDRSPAHVMPKCQRRWGEEWRSRKPSELRDTKERYTVAP